MVTRSSKVSTHGEGSLSMASEDYLEAIYRLSLEKTNDKLGVYSIEVAKLLDVSKASVSKALDALREAGMVEQTHYSRIKLTEKGMAYGRDVWQRHRVLRTFLIQQLGVEPDRANDEACLMEHDLSSDTMDRWIDYLEQCGILIEK